jgi:glycosyltransferase involved in cell wall biosynthesis
MSDADLPDRPLQVVGFSDHRPSKVDSPLSALGDGATAVTLGSGRRGPVGYLRAAREGWSAIHETEPDVVVTDHFSTLTVIGVLLALLFRTPVLARTGGNPLLVKRDRIRESLRDRSPGDLLKHVAHLLVIRGVLAVVAGCLVVSSELQTELAAELGWSAERFVVVPVPISPDEYPPGRHADGSGDGHEVLTVTNFKFEAKSEALADAAAAMARVLADDDATWTVAGGGRYLERFRRHVEAEHPAVRDRIRFPGFVPNVAALYARADVFLYLSYLDGYPNVVLEAQSAGLPVVANRAHGMAEQVEDGRSGLFVDPRNPDDVAGAVQALLEDPGRRRQLGNAGRRRVQQENTPEAVGEKLRAELRTFLNRAE